MKKLRRRRRRRKKKEKREEKSYRRVLKIIGERDFYWELIILAAR